MNPELLKEALRRHKGQGIDLKIILGGPEAAMEDEKIEDLAPEVEDKMAMEEGQGAGLVEGEEQAEGGSIDPNALLEMLNAHGKSPMRQAMMKQPGMGKAPVKEA